MQRRVGAWRYIHYGTKKSAVAIADGACSIARCTTAAGAHVRADLALRKREGAKLQAKGCYYAVRRGMALNSRNCVNTLIHCTPFNFRK